MQMIKEFLELLKFNTVSWLSIITIVELYVQGNMNGGAGLFVLYGIYKIISEK